MSTPVSPFLWTPAAPPARQRLGAAEKFLLGEFVCQLALLAPSLNTGPLRVVWRMGAFAASLALLALLPGKTRSSPTNLAAIWVMALVVLEILNPNSNTWLSAVAQATMYLAILAPLFWMTRLQFDLRRFRRVILMFWGYYSLSAMVGILQIYDPGHFQPQLSPMVASLGDAVEGLKIVLANGRTVFRPMGLTDMPGGAADAGMWAVLFGLGFLLAAAPGRNQLWKRAAYLLSMVAGMVCIYLSQARVLLVVASVWFGALLLFLFWRRRWRQFGQMAVLVLAVVGGGFVFSYRVGGSNFTNRLRTLGGSQSNQIFSQERGRFVRQAFYDFVPAYPLGAGLGRWGMMNTYFGDNSDPARGLIYVEVQWQAWILDGGVPLAVAYLFLIGAAMLGLSRVARRRGPMWIWAALCLAYDLGTLAFTFDYTPFTGQAGLEFWFINALVLGAAHCIERQYAAVS